MTFFSILLALILEQQHALRSQQLIAKLLRYSITTVATIQQFGEGKTKKHNLLAWLSIVLPWTLAVSLIYLVLYQIHFIFAFLWNIVVIYLTAGFKQFSQHFTDIQLALSNYDLPRARNILRAWTDVDTAKMPASEIIRHTLTHAVIASHRHLFGVIFWFLMPIGPAGAVLYRIAHYLAKTHPNALSEEDVSFSHFAHRAFFLIDWIPARLTAFSFAVVGNFDEACYAWRNNVRQWPDPNDGILLAASSGALGINLMGPPSEPSSVEILFDSVEPTQIEADGTPRTLSLAVALVWRAVILWMLLLLIVTVAVWVG